MFQYQICYIMSDIYIQTMAQREYRTLPLHFTHPSMALFIVLQNYLGSIPNDKPLKQIKNDLISFSQRSTPDAQKFILTQLMQNTQLSQTKDKTNIPLKATILSEMIKQFANSDHFLAYFPQIIIKVTKQNKINQYVSNLMNNIKLTLSTQIAIALALYLSDRTQLINIGETQLIARLKQYQNSDKSTKLPQKLLDQLLFQIHMSPQLNNKLNAQVKTLLEAVEKLNKNSQSRIYSYFRDQWQFFTNDAPNLEKPPVILLKKSDILRDFGPSFTFQMETMKTIISDIGPLNQEDVFECLMMMTAEKTKHDNHADKFVTDLMYLSSANSSKKNPKYNQQLKNFFKQDFTKNSYDGKIISWNIDNFLTYCTQNIQNIKWQNVFANFDRQNLTFQSQQHFVQIMRIFEKVKKFAKKWTIADNVIFREWTHPASHAQFLLHLFRCKQPDCLVFNEVQSRKSQNLPKDTNYLRQIWACQELVTLLFQVSEYKTQQIRQLFEVPILKYADTLIKTLCQIRISKGQQLADQVYAKVLPQFLQNDTKSIKILQYLWECDRNQLLSMLVTLADVQNNNSRRIFNLDLQKLVQIFQQIPGSLQQMVNLSQPSFTLPLALIAGKKEAMNFQKWLITKYQQSQNGFPKQMLLYLQRNLFQPLRLATQVDQKDTILQQSNLSPQILNKIFTIMIDKLKKQNPSSKFLQAYRKTHKQCCQIFPEVAEGHISQEAQKQCEQDFKKVYSGEVTIKQAVHHLAKMKMSPKKQQRQQYANRITFLCVQFMYYHSYPDKQLMLTADLLAQLINSNLIQKKIFQIFLHIVDQCIKEDNQKFQFAIKVMRAIKEKLAHESWFCQKLIDNDLLLRKDPQLVQAIIKCINPPKILSVEREKKLKEAIRKKSIPQPLSRHIIIEPDIHHEAAVQKPQITQFDIFLTLDRTKKIDLHDRQAKLRLINTICNTLSSNNVEQKAKQLKRTLDNEKIVKLFAYNLIFKRISMTQNNSIEVYLKLMEIIPKIEKPIMDITYKILKCWFNLSGKSVNDKKFSNFKNIGGWLGRLTIGKGLPVPIYKLNLKNILVKSFMNNNRLNFNIPVVLKILQLIHVHPDVFRPQSPWLRRIICTLIQIQTNLKQDQQIKTQIRAFFKSSKMDIQDFLSQPSLLLNQNQVFNQLLQSISISEDINRICEALQIINMKAIIARSIDMSIQEIVEPVIDRAIKIAKTTTKHIITKDFATQTSSQKVKQASLNMAKQLAGPLAQLTCRDPLKTSLAKNLKQAIKQNIKSEKWKEEQLQQLVQKIITQNLQVGSNVIKQRVARLTEKAIKQDHQLVNDLQLRNMLQRQGQFYRDEQYLSLIPSVVPKQLRPGNNGITEQQYSIYNQFKKIKSKPTLTKKQQTSDQQVDENIIDLIQQKQSVQKIKRALQNQQIQQEDVLQKIFACLLEENNDEMEQNYYLEVCQVLKQAIDPKVCWKVFKEVGNFRNKTSQRMIGKLVRSKFFQESALKQLFQQQQKSVKLFEKWTKQIKQQSVSKFIANLQKSIGFSQGNIKAFFLYCLKYVITRVSQQPTQAQQPSSIQYVQQFIKLVIAFYRASNQNYKNCIQQILQAIMQGFLKFQPKSANTSYQRTFFKIIATVICDLNSSDQQNNSMSPQKLQYFNLTLAKQLPRISPIVKPGFAFAWLQIVYNKYLIKGLLQNYENWEYYFNLLCILLKFMKDNITVAKLANNQYGLSYQTFYQAVLRLIIVIIHDFSSFLSQFSLQLCLLVDSSFIQLKNMIGSAYPSKQTYPLKFQKNQELQLLAEKAGYPKYYKLAFDKPKLNSYLNAEPKEPALKQKLTQQDDLFLQTLMLYAGWRSENGLNPNQAIVKLTEIILNSKQQIKSKLVNYAINLIRYPNHITLFFINFANYIIFKQNKDNELRELMLVNIMTRMKEEIPMAWGLIYYGKEIMSRKKELENFKVSRELLDQL